MRKKKTRRRAFLKLSLSGWQKLRNCDDLKKQVDWMISSVEGCNADSVIYRLRLKNRPWIVSLSVKRDHSRGV